MKRLSMVGFVTKPVLASLISLTAMILFAGGAQAAITCDQCHGNNAGDYRPLDTPSGSIPAYRNITTGAFKGNHLPHMAPATSQTVCTPCHGNSGYTSSHRDGIIQFNSDINTSSTGQYKVSGVPITFKNQTSVPILGSCASVNCHFESSATPDWGSAAFVSPTDCGQCHGAPPATGSHSTGGSKHGAYYGTDTTACVKCHPDHTVEAKPFAHATSVGKRNLGISFAAAPNNGSGAYSGPLNDYLPSQTNTFGYCSSIYCHSDGTKASPAFTVMSTAKWGATLTCKSCHGFDVSAGNKAIGTNKHTAHINNASYVGKNIGCQECHSATTTTGNTITTIANHVDKNVNVKLDNSINKDTDSPTYNGSATTGATGSVKAPGSAVGSCANVYCHSSGNVNNAGAAVAPTTFKTIAWDAAAIGCSGCHGDGLDAGKAHPIYANGGGATATANAHVKHVESRLYSCDYCHNTTTTNTAIPPTTVLSDGVHLDRVDNVSFKQNGGKTGTYDATAKTCSATYCHGTGPSVAWGAPPPACNSCHSANNLLPGAHQIHVQTAAVASSYTNMSGNVSTADAYRFSCAACHSPLKGALHFNGPSNANGPAQVFYGYTTATFKGGLYNYSTASAGTDPTGGFSYTDGGKRSGSCNSTYCHSNGAASNGAVVVSWAPTASSTTSNTRCIKCHNYTAASGSLIATGSHTAHVSGSTYDLSCRKCHAATTIDGSTIADRTNHVNKLVNVAFNNSTTAVSGTYNGLASPMSKVPGSAYGTCTNTYCHSKGTSLTPSSAVPNTVPNWTNNLNTNCSSCHGGNSSADFKMGTVGSATHAKHVQTYSFGCVKCHKTTVSADRTISGYASHANRQVNIEFNNSTTAVSGTYDGLASPMAKVPGSAYGTCTNTYCHSKGTSLTPSSAVPNTVPNWTNNLNTNCSSCHGGNSSADFKMGTVGSATHAKHVQTYSLGCVKCHKTTVSADRTISGYASHANRQVNIEFNNSTTAVSGAYNGSASPMTKLPGTATGTCTNTYCHSKGTSLTPSSAVPNIVPNWTNNLNATCSSCHGGNSSADFKMGTVGSATHAKHVQTYSLGCVKCHKTTVSADRTISGYASHANRQVNIEFNNSTTAVSGAYNGSASPMTKLPGTATGTCTNTYCHSKGTSLTPSSAVPNIVPNWTNNLNATCSSCHGGNSSADFKMGTVGSATHAKHVQTYGLGCVKCHKTTVSADRTISGYASHANRQVNIEFNNSTTAVSGAYNGSASPMTKLPGSAMGACDNTYCHSKGTGATGHTGDVRPLSKNTSTAWSGTITACNICHGTESGTTGAPAYANLRRSPTSAPAATGWTNPGNVYASDDARAVFNGTGQAYLYITGFGFTTTDVPDGAVIRDITVIIEGQGASATAAERQLGVVLTKSGTAVIGTEKTGANTQLYDASDRELVLGGNNDLWGTTWTPADVRATGFGVAIRDFNATATDLRIDRVRVIVHTDAAPKKNSHSNHAATYVCGTCHSDTVAADTNSPITGFAKHANVTYNVIGAKITAYTYNVAGSTCSSSCHGGLSGTAADGVPQWGVSEIDCISCHAKAQDAGDGAPTRRAMTAEFANTWSHKRAAGGAVTKFDCCVCHMEGDPATGSTTALHKNNQLDFRDPDTGVTIKGVTFSGTPGSYTSTGTDAVAATFARDTGSNTLEAFAQAVQTNLCLKCHDANGAASSSAWVPGGTASKPFGTAGGTVLNVFAHFTSGNASYHPVRAKQNNSYANANTMNAPWDFTKTAGNNTSYGYLLTCWDCHDSSSAARVIGGANAPVTSHGNAVTLRDTITKASGSATKLCVVCHKTAVYATTTVHKLATGFTAFNATNGDTNFANTSYHGAGSAYNWGCTICHGTGVYNAALPARPAPAESTHGSNTTGAGATTWSASSLAGGTATRPYAFIRNTNNLGFWNIGTGTGSAKGLCENMCGTRDYTYGPTGTY